MMRAILAGGGVALIGAFAGSLYFLSLGGPPSPGQLTSDQAGTLGIFALFGGIGSLYLASRLAPRFILDHDDCRMDCGFQRVSSHADRGGANDLRKVRYYSRDRL